MIAASKAMIAAFYGAAPKFSYFNGCSTGGRQALMEAQRYPEDFDGIIAGAPANNHIHLHTAALARAIDLRKDPDGAVPAETLAGLAAAVIEACDGLDGVKDGIVSNPRACHFDPSSLLCHGADTESCLTAAQVQSVKRMYAPTTLKSGEVAWSGDEFGSESGWAPIGGASTSPPGGIALDTMRYLGHQDPNWDWRMFDLDRDTALADKNAGFINSIDPNPRAFKAHGGKLLLYHGWADATIAPGHTIDYYSSVLSTMGSGQGDWVRLFMAPGMQHCGGGPGPNQANFMGALERWRESGTAPDRILASHVSSGRVDMTRPLCPYPQTAVYSGVGSTDDAANFVCK
jgi:feruloyl esterase